MVLLGVAGMAELESWAGRISDRKSVFVEPDIGEQPTALACLPADGKMFRGLPLL